MMRSTAPTNFGSSVAGTEIRDWPPSFSSIKMPASLMARTASLETSTRTTSLPDRCSQPPKIPPIAPAPPRTAIRIGFGVSSVRARSELVARAGGAPPALIDVRLSGIVSACKPNVKHDGMIGSMLEPVTIERKKLFQQVAAHLERLILDGRLKPGDQLPPERDLQNRFGVGRPAIREALIALQRSGLIVISNGSRARVAMPTAHAVVSGMGSAVMQLLSTKEGQRHFQGVRLFFEAALARHAAREASATQIDELKKKLAANRAAIGDRERFIETDVAFHFVLAEITGNPAFVALHDAMSEWLKEQRVVTLDAPRQEKIAYKAHVAIFEAIAMRDPDRAESAMADHMRQLEQTFWRQRDGR